MKNRLRKFVAAMIARTFIALGLVRTVKSGAQKGKFILSIYFHEPDKALFEFCISWLLKNGFQFLSEEDIVKITSNEQAFPKAGVIITVDDGWQSNKENIVAIADKYKIPVTIFITTNAIVNGNFWWQYSDEAERMHMEYPSTHTLKKVPDEVRIQTLKEIKKEITFPRSALSLNELIEITDSENIFIGAHTVNHPILVNCKERDSFKEIRESKMQIEQWLQTQVNSFAYPNGDYSDREIEFVRELGFRLAFTTKPEYLSPEKLREVYELPRFCVFENISKPEAICRMTGVWQKYFKGA